MACENDPITINKTVSDKWDETINWADPARELGNDTIDTSSWAYTGPDNALLLTDPSIGDPAVTTTVFLGAGTLGAFYTVTNTIVTVGGRTLTGSFIVSIVSYSYLSNSACC